MQHCLQQWPPFHVLCFRGTIPVHWPSFHVLAEERLAHTCFGGICTLAVLQSRPPLPGKCSLHAVLRIQVVYPGPRSRDPGSNSHNKKRREETISCFTFFCSHKFHRWSLSSPKYGWGSGIRKKPISDPGPGAKVKKVADPGSATLVTC
jgi:hypothetical protein